MEKPQFIKALLLAFFLVCTQILLAQEGRLGFNIGFGHTKISDDFNESRYDDIIGDYWTGGAIYYYTLGKSIVDVGGGVQLSYHGIEDMNLYYLKVPASLDFHYGNVVQFTAGAGVSANLLLASNVLESTFPTYENSKESYQIDVFVRGGLIYKLNDRYQIKMLYNYQFGNIPVFDTYRSVGHGPTSKTGMFDREQFITIELNFKLSK